MTVFAQAPYGEKKKKMHGMTLQCLLLDNYTNINRIKTLKFKNAEHHQKHIIM